MPVGGRPPTTHHDAAGSVAGRRKAYEASKRRRRQAARDGLKTKTNGPLVRHYFPQRACLFGRERCTPGSERGIPPPAEDWPPASIKPRACDDTGSYIRSSLDVCNSALPGRILKKTSLLNRTGSRLPPWIGFSPRYWIGPRLLSWAGSWLSPDCGIPDVV